MRNIRFDHFNTCGWIVIGIWLLRLWTGPRSDLIERTLGGLCVDCCRIDLVLNLILKAGDKLLSVIDAEAFQCAVILLSLFVVKEAILRRVHLDGPLFAAALVYMRVIHDIPE